MKSHGQKSWMLLLPIQIAGACNRNPNVPDTALRGVWGAKEIMILFPEALNPARNMAKYNNTTLWLCSYNQVVNPNIRDLYSAGGKITHVNGKRLKRPVAQVFNVIVEYSDEIKSLLRHPSAEMLMMIQDYNPILLDNGDLYESWLEICCEFAEENDVPLKEWIKEKPCFMFSK